MVTTIALILACFTFSARISLISSGVFPSYSAANRIPASPILQIKQSNLLIKSRLCTAILILDTSAKIFLLCFFASSKDFLITSVSISISTTIASAWEKISSPFSSNNGTTCIIFGRLEMEPATSPLLSNTASHVSMPSGFVII